MNVRNKQAGVNIKREKCGEPAAQQYTFMKCPELTAATHVQLSHYT